MKFRARKRATPAAHPRPSARSGMSSGTGPLPNDPNNEEGGCQRKGIDDERMREDVLSEWPPLAQQAEAEPRDTDRAIPVA
jgi:hypothetical protein